MSSHEACYEGQRLLTLAANIVDGRVLFVEGFHDEVVSGRQDELGGMKARLLKGGQACFLSARGILGRCNEVIRYLLPFMVVGEYEIAGSVTAFLDGKTYWDLCQGD